MHSSYMIIHIRLAICTFSADIAFKPRLWKMTIQMSRNSTVFTNRCTPRAKETFFKLISVEICMIFEQPAILKSFTAFNSIACKLHNPHCFLVVAIYVFLKTQNLKVLQVSFLFFHLWFLCIWFPKWSLECPWKGQILQLYFPIVFSCIFSKWSFRSFFR